MRYSILATVLLLSSSLASPLVARNGDSHNDQEDRDNEGGLRPICKDLKTRDHGCIRYVRGFDITGVVTEVDLTFKDGIKNECDCIKACLNAPTTCANYVWKFSTPESIVSGHRTCTLYSDFNLPSKVALEMDLNSQNNMNIIPQKIIANNNNPHNGGLVPMATKDSAGTVFDSDAVSGPIWQLSNGDVVC